MSRKTSDSTAGLTKTLRLYDSQHRVRHSALAAEPVTFARCLPPDLDGTRVRSLKSSMKSDRLRRGGIAFSDVNLPEDIEYAKEFFKALIPLKKEWGGLASTRIAQDEDLLRLMHQSGCKFSADRL